MWACGKYFIFFMLFYMIFILHSVLFNHTESWDCDQEREKESSLDDREKRHRWKNLAIFLHDIYFCQMLEMISFCVSLCMWLGLCLFPFVFVLLWRFFLFIRLFSNKVSNWGGLFLSTTHNKNMQNISIYLFIFSSCLWDDLRSQTRSCHCCCWC